MQSTQLLERQPEEAQVLRCFCLSVCLSVCLLACLLACLLVCLFVCLFVCVVVVLFRRGRRCRPLCPAVPPARQVTKRLRCPRRRRSLPSWRRRDRAAPGKPRKGSMRCRERIDLERTFLFFLVCVFFSMVWAIFPVLAQKSCTHSILFFPHGLGLSFFRLGPKGWPCSSIFWAIFPS